MRWNPKKLLVAVLLSSLGPSLATPAGTAADEARALLQRAREIGDYRASGSPPFYLKSAVRLFGDKGAMQEGTYELWWQAPDRYREELRLTGYDETRIVNGNLWWRHRSLGYLPLRVGQLFGLMVYPKEWLKGREDIRVARQEKEEADGVSRLVVQFEKGGESLYRFGGPGGAVSCVESTQSVTEYAEWAPFHEKAVPRSLRILEAKAPIAEARIQELYDAKEQDPALFTFPEGAIPWPWCPSPEPAKLAKSVKPVYPPSMASGGTQGKVEVYLVLDEVGAVKEATVMRTAGKAFDKAALDAVRQWRFHPARCGETPIPCQHRLTINFTMSVEAPPR